ncbi:MAG: hypothetical protein II631_02025, partial [Treponema sp.]|nr:hypothetical protein [Treponema sp.]
MVSWKNRKYYGQKTGNKNYDYIAEGYVHHKAHKKKYRYEYARSSQVRLQKDKSHCLPTSLEQALDALEQDHDYLTAGGVFPEELLQGFIARKRAECRELSQIPHPAEF